MFALPNAKRVRRDELHEDAEVERDSSPDAALTEILRERVREEFVFDNGNAMDITDGKGGEGEAEEEEEAELILFAAPASMPTSDAKQAHKIRIASPVLENTESGFIVPNRPRSYYFSDEVQSEQEAEIQAAAIEGEDVRAFAHIPWAGCALPWKVSTISRKGLNKAVLIGHVNKELLTVGGEGEKKRTRKGKKARIALRKKIRARLVRDEERLKAEKEKEDAEREKRTRRNREKKVKKRARDKAKKAETKLNEEGGDGAGASSGSDD